VLTFVSTVFCEQTAARIGILDLVQKHSPFTRFILNLLKSTTVFVFLPHSSGFVSVAGSHKESLAIKSLIGIQVFMNSRNSASWMTK